MKFFKEVNTIEELKQQYRKLAKKYHPDVAGGNTQAMKDINNEYESLHAKIASGSKNAERMNVNDGFREIVNALIKMEGLTVELCGSWLWVGGDTFDHKDKLKELGFRWAKKKKLWYWGESVTGKKRSSFKMEKIREVYGSEYIKKDKEKKKNRPMQLT